MKTTIQLCHNQEIRIKGFSRFANKITVGTCRGYSGEESHQCAIENGHDTAWANQSASVLCADYPGKQEALDAAAAATAASPEIEDGQVVEIEGELFTAKVTGERYSDPVHFKRING